MNVRRTQRHASSQAGRAFTLIELMIVIGIIGLVVALGVPLFGVLTGARSQEAGQNLVAAAIGQARTIALSEGKYAGVLFYIDPATERTAMTVVTAGAGLEDPDPYDKYKTFIGGQVYRSPAVDTAGNAVAGDRAITIVSDASATFRNGPTSGVPAQNKDVYNASSFAYSDLTKYFGNFKPSVPVYRAVMPPTTPGTTTFGTVADSPGNRPPRHGPSDATNGRHRRILPVADDTFPIGESTSGTFQNDNWSVDQLLSVSPLDGAERQLLPLGVGVQIIIQPTNRSDLPEPATVTPATTNQERYVRVGLIMFDPQGKLSLDSRTVPMAGTLGTQLGLTADVPSVAAGVGVVLYDRAAFRLVTNSTEADFIYQNVAANTSNRLRSTLPLYNDMTQPTPAANMNNERTEEQWLDGNTVPLLINRYSGALSEAQ